MNGVGQVFVGGGALPAVRVELTPGSAQQVWARHEMTWPLQYNQSLFQPERQLSKRVADRGNRCKRPAPHSRAIPPGHRKISKRGGGPVSSDLGTVDDSVQDLRTGGGVYGKPAIMLVVFRSPGANIISTVDRVRAMLPQLSALVPGSVELSVVLDRSPPIRGFFAACRAHPYYSAILVVLVVLPSCGMCGQRSFRR